MLPKREQGAGLGRPCSTTYVVLERSPYFLQTATRLVVALTGEKL